MHMPRPFVLRWLMLLAFLCWQPVDLLAKTSPLATPPDWSWLEGYANVFTRTQFQQALETFYARNGAATACIELGELSVRIRTSGEDWREVPFASDDKSRKPAPRRFWKKAAELGPAPAGRPLQGVKVAIDPGHLGGEWAKMEERFFQLGNTRAVVEGDITLAVARRLKPTLEKLGAQVTLLRKSDRPVTRDRAKNLQSAAAADLTGTITPERLRRQSELFFYRISEIRARAQQVNERIKPDVVVCLHLNAEEWGEPENPQLQPRNHLHALVNGCYGTKELECDDVRAEMLQQLFARVIEEAIPLGETVVETLAEESGLPPFSYFSSNAIRVGNGPYLYARNLLANRLYRAPVVFLEPYVMNSQPVWSRIQLGDYSGEKMVEGRSRKSLAAEYADGVAGGLACYYKKARSLESP